MMMPSGVCHHPVLVRHRRASALRRHHADLLYLVTLFLNFHLAPVLLVAQAVQVVHRVCQAAAQVHRAAQVRAVRQVCRAVVQVHRVV